MVSCDTVVFITCYHVTVKVEVLSILKHPNIIAYFDNFVEEKSLMIVMEYAPGGTLFEFIQDRNGVLLEEEVCPHGFVW